MRRIRCITMGIHCAFQDIDFLRQDTNDFEKATNLYDDVGGLCNMKSKWCNEFGALKPVFTPLFTTLSFFDSSLTTLKRRWICTMWLAVFRRWKHLVFVRCCWRFVENEIRMIPRVGRITTGFHYPFQDIEFHQVTPNYLEKAMNLYDVVGVWLKMK